MGEWKSCTLSSLGTIVGGATPSTKKPENYEGGTIPYQGLQVDIFLTEKETLQKKD